MRHARRLLSRLADRQLHSGARLGSALGIGPHAVGAAVDELRALGIPIAAERDEGYRLTEPLELLDEVRILDALAPESRRQLAGFEILFETHSTNDHLRTLAAKGAPHPYACLAEMQSAGRGRRGRTWRSPLARNVYLSLLWRFETRRLGVPGLSPAVAVAVADALEAIGLRDLALKWPNDLKWQGRKLGGVLLEVTGGCDDGWEAVIGIGLNVRMTGSRVEGIEQPWTDVETAAGHRVSRNEVAARLIEHALDAATRYEVGGFPAFRAGWDRRDESRGHAVRVVDRERSFEGTALGLDDDGALLVSVGGEVERVWSGDVSLRAGK